MGLIKRFIPEFVLKVIRPFYHGAMAFLASLYYGRPSEKMIVIGITGTAGKSTTAHMLARILNLAGKKCGFITTVSFFDGQEEYINKHGLSMPGGWLLQKQLKTMLDKSCRYAIIECTSEGLAQNRHLGVSFDMAVFTNLSDAHLETHVGFENYKKAKGRFFSKLRAKKLRLSMSTIIVNLDDPQAGYFLSFPVQKRIGACFTSWSTQAVDKIFSALSTKAGFDLNGEKFEIKLIGKFNHKNALLAAVAANSLGVSLFECARALASFTKIRGRMEPVENDRELLIFVDYGCEPATFKAALMAVNELPHKRVIHVFGSTGGHRDKQKRFIFGQTSAEYADYIIITNDDIYNSDPEEIASNIESGILEAKSDPFDGLRAGKRKAKNYQTILDRRQAIHHALSIARAGDVVLITGKGSEQFLVLPGNQRIQWDEVEVVKQELQKIPNPQ